LSDLDGTVSVAFNPWMPGSMSTANDNFKNMGFFYENAELRRASAILGPIFEKHHEKIMLKIDCEGSERQILPDLAAAGLLDRASVLIMEYHDNIVEPLVELLKQHHFDVDVYNESAEYKTGMIKALRAI